MAAMNIIRRVLDTLHYYFWDLLWPVGIYCAWVSYLIYGNYSRLFEKAHPYPFGKALYEWSNFIQGPVTLFVIVCMMLLCIWFFRLIGLIHTHLEQILMRHLDARLPQNLAILSKGVYVVFYVLPVMLAALCVQVALTIILPAMVINFLYWDVFFEWIIGVPRTVFDLVGT